ncbi:MAG TPA: hypothetical protein VK473_00680 [Terriglobales bacterium]|nr:hypothetical protein [Terriglobales bacterium]
MKPLRQWRTTATLVVLLVSCLSAAVVTLRAIDRIRSSSSTPEALYVPSAAAARRLSLGYTGLAADLYWTRAVQYFGRKHHEYAGSYPLLYSLLDIATTLDPHLLPAYSFGVAFLASAPPNGAGMADKAVELVERGIQSNPNDWHLYYELGFVQAMELQDYVAAARSFERGSKLPNAHPFLKVLAASMAQHGGDLETARLMWQTALDSSDDPSIRYNAFKHLQALRVDEDVPRLEALVRAYQEKTGHLPTGFDELVAAGWLRGLPADPAGHPYRLLRDGKVVVQDPKELPFIKQGLPPDYQPALKTLP